MAGNRMGEQTREKILAAAEVEFIQKGFEKSRVEEIAARAGVTKVMLYYHFNTKQNIFNEIVKKTIDEIKTEFSANMKPEDRIDPEAFRDHLDDMLAYYRKKQEILRLILSEYIVHRIEDESLSAFNEVFSLILNFSGKDPRSGQDDFLTRIFFFNALPMLLYSCLADSFCRDFNIAPEKAGQVFLNTFIRTFGQNVGTPDQSTGLTV